MDPRLLFCWAPYRRLGKIRTDSSRVPWHQLHRIDIAICICADATPLARAVRKDMHEFPRRRYNLQMTDISCWRIIGDRTTDVVVRPVPRDRDHVAVDRHEAQKCGFGPWPHFHQRVSSHDRRGCQQRADPEKQRATVDHDPITSVANPRAAQTKDVPQIHVPIFSPKACAPCRFVIEVGQKRPTPQQRKIDRTADRQFS